MSDNQFIQRIHQLIDYRLAILVERDNLKWLPPEVVEEIEDLISMLEEYLGTFYW